MKSALCIVKYRVWYRFIHIFSISWICISHIWGYTNSQVVCVCTRTPFFLVGVGGQHNFIFRINLLWFYFVPDFSRNHMGILAKFYLWSPKAIVVIQGKQDAVMICSMSSNSVCIWLFPVYCLTVDCLRAGSRILGLYFRTALAHISGLFCSPSNKK